MVVPRHVTLLSAIFVSHLLLGAVHSAPNTALLKLLATAKQSHNPDNNNNNNNVPSSSSSSFSFIDPPFSSSNNNQNGDENENDSLWLTGDPNQVLPEQEVEDAEEGEGGELVLPETAKRFHPSAFYGSRGKRMELAKRFFQQGFVGSRGKRVSFGAGRVGGEREGDGERRMMRMRMVKKGFHPTAFTAVRGKRYMPGLEALFLSQMYKKLDAEKWKRQSLLGFHAARG